MQGRHFSPLRKNLWASKEFPELSPETVGIVIGVRRRSSRAGSVSMDRNVETQQEVDLAARQVKEKPYGKAILILAK